jgi:hypothetical protein
MFDKNIVFDEELITSVKNGECLPPEGYKFDGTSIVLKSEDELLADDWNSSIERKAEYTDYLTWSIDKMERYLSETDWYVSRKEETNKAIPEDVLNTRAEYREKISDFRKRLEEIPEEDV